jgi:hypothetical protein
VSMDRDLYPQDGLLSERLQSWANALFDDSMSR